MVDLEKVRIFYHVAKEGSLKRASQVLELSESVISRHLSRLETELQIKLFVRRKAGLALTDDGETFYAKINLSMSNLETVIAESPHDRENKKDIRIITTNGIIGIMVSSLLPEFLDENPDVNVRMTTITQGVDLVSSKADVAIMNKIQSDGAIQHRRLFTFHNYLYASETYLKKYGAPKNIADLDNHHLISSYPEMPGHRGNVDWHLKKDHDVHTYRRARFAVDSSACSLEAAEKGMGIVSVGQEFPYLERYGLVKILPHHGSDVDIFFISRSFEIPSPIIEKLYNFLKNNLGGFSD